MGKARDLAERAQKEVQTLKQRAQDLDTAASSAELDAELSEGSQGSATKAREAASSAIRNVEDRAQGDDQTPR